MISNDLIKKELRLVHPDSRISKEGIYEIQKLLKKYDDLEVDEVLENLPGEIKKHAQTEYDKAEKKKPGRGKDGLMEYILAEILELSGNVARDNRKITINAYHIWTSILCDEELKEMFIDMKPLIPVLFPRNSYRKNEKVTKTHIRNMIKKMDIAIDSSIPKILQYIMIILSSYYHSDELIIKKLKESFSKKPSSDVPLITQLQNNILKYIFELLKEKDKKITFTILNDAIAGDDTEIFDFLKN